ncbi:hypothetical protein [Acetobacter sp.]|uniref:hypothetical protein n=1 Tax=Acetobacter sp. TaxID=440 RepID=UPI0025B9C488|nr:hypothetical protein [Acetobacter sp.]MCH4091855.1 hypothetical protein [Acetobacter sp.]
MTDVNQATQTLLGIGLYTPAEAGLLIGVRPGKLRRWLHGYQIGERRYQPLWHPQVDLGDDKVYLGFRDMLEARVASEFIEAGLSPQRVRRAIEIAQSIVGERPLSTEWLKTDGRSVFLQIANEDPEIEPQCLDLFRNQYAFARIVRESLRDIEFTDKLPNLWWPQGQKAGVLIDPHRSFGKPIEHETSVPAEQLANAAIAEGSVEHAARVWDVPVRAVKRAVAFQKQLAASALAA